MISLFILIITRVRATFELRERHYLFQTHWTTWAKTKGSWPSDNRNPLFEKTKAHPVILCESLTEMSHYAPLEGIFKDTLTLAPIMLSNGNMPFQDPSLDCSV